MDNLKTLVVQKRLGLGKGPNRRLHKKNLIPGIFYTSGGENIPIQLPELPFTKIFSEVGRTTVFNLKIESDKENITHPVIIWDLQYYPVKNRFMHVDLYGVKLNKPIKIVVPLEFTGTARGTKVGGKLETYREQLTLIANPLDMPSKVTLDISDLDIGKSIYVADLKLPEGVKTSYDTNYAIVSVIMPGGNTATEQEG